MDTKVFDIYSDGIGKKTRHMFRGFDSLSDLESYTRACGVEQPLWLIMTVVATVRNVIDDELEARAKIAKDLEDELKTYQVKEIETGKIYSWTLSQVLEEINRDRSEDWTAYNESDWREGWNEFVEGDVYTMST